jgi:hypothetical protein
VLWRQIRDKHDGGFITGFEPEKTRRESSQKVRSNPAVLSMVL